MKNFSTGARFELVDNNGNLYQTYQRFYAYYGDYDYADKWVSAALTGTDMVFASGKHGPNNFSTLGDAARIEAVKKGTAYMNVWMYAISKFEDALDDCETCRAPDATPPAPPPLAACNDACTDVPTAFFVSSGLTCKTAVAVLGNIFNQQCDGAKINGQDWPGNVNCQQTCADVGHNYASPPCCTSQPVPPAAPPSPPPTTCNEHASSTQSVHAWDKGVAFYTGSLEGTVYGGNGAGKLHPSPEAPKLSRTPALSRPPAPKPNLEPHP